MGIDWRMGAEWFETCLLDYDPCSNYGNWTYGAGTLLIISWIISVGLHNPQIRNNFNMVMVNFLYKKSSWTG